MKLRYYVIALITALILGVIGALVLFPVPETTVDTARINDMIQRGETLDNSTFADMPALWKTYRAHLQAGLVALLFAVTAIAVCFLFVLHRGILRPFKRMRGFAQNIAAGNLDVPLGMDRRGSFGAFTESLDLMREELKTARDNERKAGQSKKELVASLSHDIKTPVASIKAVAELMAAKSPDKQLEIIMSKADQIDLLITNMFNATLEELEQLKVTPEELSSAVLYELMQNADYDRKVKPFTVPECIVGMDKTRLQQVFDNIVSNSYKYAGTEITVTSYFDGPHLTVEISDCGPGAAPDDLPLIFGKFYRGGNAAGKSGAGLGLYISKHLMGKMGGDIQCEPNESGFTVKIYLRIS